jgi:hypothetical protein
MAVDSPRRGKIHFELTTNPVVREDRVGFFRRDGSHWVLIGLARTNRQGAVDATFAAPPGKRWHVAAVVAAHGPNTRYAVSPIEKVHVRS